MSERKCANCARPAMIGEKLCYVCEFARMVRMGGLTISGAVAQIENDHPETRTDLQPIAKPVHQCEKHPNSVMLDLDGHELCKACVDGTDALSIPDNGKEIS